MSSCFALRNPAWPLVKVFWKDKNLPTMPQSSFLRIMKNSSIIPRETGGTDNPTAMESPVPVTFQAAWALGHSTHQLGLSSVTKASGEKGLQRQENQ